MALLPSSLTVLGAEQGRSRQTFLPLSTAKYTCDLDTTQIFLFHRNLLLLYFPLLQVKH